MALLFVYDYTKGNKLVQLSSLFALFLILNNYQTPCRQRVGQKKHSLSWEIIKQFCNSEIAKQQKSNIKHRYEIKKQQKKNEKKKQQKRRRRKEETSSQ